MRITRPSADRNEPKQEPQVDSSIKTYRLSLVFDRASGTSHIVQKTVRNRVVDPARLLPGTWAVKFHDQQQVDINEQKVVRSAINPSQLILIAERLFPGYHFAAHMGEVSEALKHDGKRPVIQLPAGAYNFNSEDLSGQYKVVPRGVRVVSTNGEPLWPLMHEIS